MGEERNGLERSGVDWLGVSLFVAKVLNNSYYYYYNELLSLQRNGWVWKGKVRNGEERTGMEWLSASMIQPLILIIIGFYALYKFVAWGFGE